MYVNNGNFCKMFFHQSRKYFLDRQKILKYLLVLYQQEEKID